MLQNRIVRKLLAGDDTRRTRFHDEAGHSCGFVNGFGIIPSAWSVVQAKMRGQWLRLPWWVWGAVSFVEAHLNSRDRVIEIGAGYSSLWLAERCSFVYSVEESEHWLHRLGSMADDLGLASKLTLIHAGARQGLRRAIETMRNPDVVVIDSESRREIFLELLAQEFVPRVLVYDDTDKCENRGITQLGTERGYSVHTFRGFKPQCLHVCETTVLVRADTPVPREANPASTQ